MLTFRRCFSLSAKQFLISAVATHIDPFIPRLWPFRESGHSFGLGTFDCGRPVLGIFPCNAKSYRSIAWRASNFMGVRGRLLIILPKKALSTMHAWKPVILMKLKFLFVSFLNFKIDFIPFHLNNWFYSPWKKPIDLLHFEMQENIRRSTGCMCCNLYSVNILGTGCQCICANAFGDSNVHIAVLSDQRVSIITKYNYVPLCLRISSLMIITF